MGCWPMLCRTLVRRPARFLCELELGAEALSACSELASSTKPSESIGEQAERIKPSIGEQTERIKPSA